MSISGLDQLLAYSKKKKENSSGTVGYLIKNATIVTEK